jgi:hypothetical protein
MRDKIAMLSFHTFSCEKIVLKRIANRIFTRWLNEKQGPGADGGAAAEKGGFHRENRELVRARIERFRPVKTRATEPAGKGAGLMTLSAGAHKKRPQNSTI